MLPVDGFPRAVENILITETGRSCDFTIECVYRPIEFRPNDLASPPQRA